MDKKLNGFITMSKNALNIYTLSITTQREFHKLMNSKESFSKNLSSAENLKLKILYEQLQKAWNLNNTEELKEDLDKKYNELRLIQNELKKNSKNIEMEFEVELKEILKQEERILEQRKKTLIEKKKNIISSLKKMKEQSENEIELWKNDILREEQKLKKGKENLENQSSKLNSLNQLKENIEKSNKKLQEVLQELEKEKKITSKLENNYLKNIKDYEKTQKNGLKDKTLKLNQKKKDFQAFLNKERETLNLNLKEFEEIELNKLKGQIIQENPNSPRDLKEYLLQEAFSMIGMKEKTLLKEIEQRWNALKRGLTKNGIKASDYIKKMEKNIK